MDIGRVSFCLGLPIISGRKFSSSADRGLTNPRAVLPVIDSSSDSPNHTICQQYPVPIACQSGQILGAKSQNFFSPLVENFEALRRNQGARLKPFQGAADLNSWDTQFSITHMPILSMIIYYISITFYGSPQ
jgi:hypothetical protein